MQRFIAAVIASALLFTPICAALPITQQHIEQIDAAAGGIYINESYGFKITMPPVVMENVRLTGYESKNGKFKYQLNAAFYPKNIELNEIRLNVFTVFVMDSADFTEAVEADGSIRLFEKDNMTYAIKFYDNIYGKTTIGTTYETLKSAIMELTPELMVTSSVPDVTGILSALVASKAVYEQPNLLPIRLVFETLGYDVAWSNGEICAQKGTSEFKFKVGSSAFSADGLSKKAGCNVININGCTYMDTAVLKTAVDCAKTSFYVSPLGFLIDTKDAQSKCQITVTDAKTPAQGSVASAFTLTYPDGNSLNFTVDTFGIEAWTELVGEHNEPKQRIGASADGNTIYTLRGVTGLESVDIASLITLY